LLRAVGPRSRKILARLTPADLSNEAFRFMTAQQITVADVPVRALRVTFGGELGWELYAASEFGAGLGRDLWSAGVDLGLVAGGYRAIDSMRLEKGYRDWGADITPETTPYEAGLGFSSSSASPADSRDATRSSHPRSVGRSADSARSRCTIRTPLY